MTAGGVVLAGGEGRRFGAPKGEVRLGGMTLAARTASLLQRAVGGGPVTVAFGAGSTDHGQLPANISVTRDPVAGVGPMAGLAAGLRELQGRAGLAIVVPCDMPLVHPAVLRAIGEMLADSESNVAALTDRSGRPRPFPGAWRTLLADRAAEAIASLELRPWVIAAESLRPITSAELASQPEVARVDPELRSLLDADDQERFRDLTASAPKVRAITAGRRKAIRAWSLAELIDLVGARSDSPITVNGLPVADPGLFALAGDDTVAIG